MEIENNIVTRKEYELLLCCARIRVNEKLKEKIVYLIHEEFDWQYLLKIASKHRLKTLLYYNLNSICPEMVPDDILNELKEYFNGNIRKNLLLTGELIKILELLKSNNISAISYKGPFLAHSAYGNIGLRVFRDIDILIHKPDALKAKDLMISAGYELYLPVKINDSQYLNLDSEYRFFDEEKTVMIEINWNFEGIFFSFPYNPQFLFDNLKTFNFMDNLVYDVSSQSQLLILCIHSAKHDWGRLSWICDISEFLNSVEDIDWCEVLKNADKMGVKRILFINLLLAKDLFQLDLPDYILNELNSDSNALKLSNSIKKRIFENRSFNLFEKFIFDIKKRDKIRYGVKDSINGLFKPSYADFQLFPLPERLFFLYYLLRPFSLLKRYFMS